MEKVMIVCQECSAQQLNGSLFCSECGGYLLAGEEIQPVTVDMELVPVSDLIPADTMRGEQWASKPVLSLLLLDTNNKIDLTGKEVYTLGRLSDGQSILPDIDLTPFHAYEKGVSRLHAAIKTSFGEIAIIDLGSVNGTRINGVKILPTKVYPLQNQDFLDLGKMKLKILFNSIEASKDGE
jgi:pSer/pThr/pTyr-binding forkhead associated (FHA) protein